MERSQLVCCRLSCKKSGGVINLPDKMGHGDTKEVSAQYRLIWRFGPDRP